jgi:hypothetical protein
MLNDIPITTAVLHCRSGEDHSQEEYSLMLLLFLHVVSHLITCRRLLFDKTKPDIVATFVHHQQTF